MKRRSDIFASLGLGAILAFVGMTNASATAVYTNFAASQGYDINNGNAIGNAFDGNNYAEGSSFTTGSSATFGSLIIALSCVAANCPGGDTFVVSLEADNSDAPGAVLESFTVSDSLLGALGVNNTPLTLTSILNPTLNAATRYWVVVSTTFSGDSIAWNNNTTGDVSDQAQSIDGGATWSSPSLLTPGAFEVDSFTAVVGTPEPTTTGLVGGGLLALLLAKARRAKLARRS